MFWSILLGLEAFRTLDGVAVLVTMAGVALVSVKDYGQGAQETIWGDVLGLVCFFSSSP
jgi:hypothetical protein